MEEQDTNVNIYNWGPCLMKCTITNELKDLLLSEAKVGFDYKDKLAGIIEKETGIDLKPIPNLTWKKSLKGLRNGTIKMVPCCAVTPNREEYLNFSDIYIEDPIVIVSRKPGPYLSKLEDLKNKKIALSNNYYTIELIKNKYPDIEIIEKESIIQCLESVTNGEASAFVGNLNVITYHMNHMGFNNLHIVGTTPFKSGNIALTLFSLLTSFSLFLIP